MSTRQKPHRHRRRRPRHRIRDRRLQSRGSPSRSGWPDWSRNWCRSSASCRALVSSLVNSRSPSTIRWLIVAVVVDALECQFWRPSSHIGEEIGEVQPTLADCDASASIVFKCGHIGVQAPTQHRRPDAVLSAVARAYRVAMRYGSRSGYLNRATAAALRQTFPQAAGIYDLFVSAIAPTEPKRIATIGASTLDYRPAAKPSAREIMGESHVSL